MTVKVQFNLEAEQSLIGAMLIRPAIIAGVRQGLVPEEFYLDRHRRMYALMLEMEEAGEQVDPITVGDRLALSASEKVELHTLQQICPVVANWPGYAGIVRRESINRDLAALGKQMADGEASAEDSEKRLSQIREKMIRHEVGVKTVSMAQAAAEVLGYTENPMPQGLDYPWPNVNRLTRGMRPGWLTYLAGYTRHGKTAAAIATAVNVAKQGGQVLFVSLEMSAVEIAVRVSQNWGLDSERLYLGHPNESDRDAARLANEFPAHQNIEVAYLPSVSEISRQVERMSPNLVIIDYLQLMDIEFGDTLRVGTTKNSNALKRMARKYDVHTLCLSQLSRPSKVEAAKAPTVHDLKESGSLEQDADGIIFVWRPADDHGNPQDEGAFIVAKSRMGSMGREEFIFDGKRQLFRLPALEHQSSWQNRADLS